MMNFLIRTPLLFGHIVLCLLWSLQLCHSWTMPASTTRTGRAPFLFAQSSFVTSAPCTGTSLYSRRLPLEDDDDDDLEELQKSIGDQIDWDKLPSSSSRRRLEMQWELAEAADNCDVERPQSCGSAPCQDCNGQGWNPCRFCRGTSVLYLPQNELQEGQFVSCKICQQGTERCRSCQGTGWVAGWTQLQSSAH